MCRIRFGIDGIYFEELEPIQIRHNHYQPLISNLPSARDKVSANGTVVVDAGAGRKVAYHGLLSLRRLKSTAEE